MKLTIQPIITDGRKFLDDISFIIPILVSVFGFEKQTFVINKPISQLPGQLFDCKRNQYRSDHLLSWLHQTLKPSISTKLLAVCTFDAYFGNYNFCFGEANIGGTVAAIYLQRLLPQFSNDDLNFRILFQDRIVKEAIHEIGHTFSLRHCSLNSCIMYKSKTISDTDKKSKEFCSVCQISLARFLESTAQ